MWEAILGKGAAKLNGHDPRDYRGATVSELAATYGLTATQARRVRAVLDIAKKVEYSPLAVGSVFTRGADVWAYFGPRLRELLVEQFHVVLLNGKHRVIREELISQGTLTSSPVHPREVFAPAIRHSAAAIILVHNHPSGDPTPSADDIEITRRLAQVGELVGIRVLDHVIVGNESFVSLSEKEII